MERYYSNPFGHIQRNLKRAELEISVRLSSNGGLIEFSFAFNFAL
jgi:hypothetical protein